MGTHKDRIECRNSEEAGRRPDGPLVCDLPSTPAHYRGDQVLGQGFASGSGACQSIVWEESGRHALSELEILS